MQASESAPAEPVLLRRDGAVAVLQLNRPAAFNALDVPTATAFLAACRRLAEAATCAPSSSRAPAAASASAATSRRCATRAQPSSRRS